MFADISDKIAKVALENGLIKTAEVESLSKEDSDKVLPAGSIFFGSNARAKGRRASALFGWKPVEGKLEEDIARVVKDEAGRM